MIKYAHKEAADMNYQNVFKRYEFKYILDKTQYEMIQNAMKGHMTIDEYGKSTIYNIYFDTPDDLLVRRSIEKPVYKEKLRLRSYGIAKSDSITYIELKKKYESVVYKRRISATYQAAMDYLINGVKFEDSQISREIDYFMEFYKDIRPVQAISYERYAYYDNAGSDFRVTFDTNILARDYDLSLIKKPEGKPVLDEEKILMEIKTGAAIPLWMCETLSKNRIYKTTFSKYGTAYVNNFRRKKSC